MGLYVDILDEACFNHTNRTTGSSANIIAVLCRSYLANLAYIYIFFYWTYNFGYSTQLAYIHTY